MNVPLSQVLHCIQNIGAEITRFADREFYRDWWNARDWATFYRKWNGVVHDWIHSYIFCDLIELQQWQPWTAKAFSFFFSALIHELLLMWAFRFFYPLLFCMFLGPGVLFISLTANRKEGMFWNTFMWLMLATGNAILFFAYGLEYYTRKSLVDAGEQSPFWIPQSITLYRS